MPCHRPAPWTKSSRLRRYRSKLIHIGIGRAHAGTRVLLLVADQHIRVITDNGELLRELTIDPNRNNQPRRT